MKNLLTAFLLLAPFLNTYSQGDEYKNWETIKLPGICRFKIPPTMEMVDIQEKGWADDITEAVIYPRGFNKAEYFATYLYSAIIISRREGDNRKFMKDLSGLQEMAKSEKSSYKRAYREILTHTLKGIVKIDCVLDAGVKKISGKKALFFSFIGVDSVDRANCKCYIIQIIEPFEVVQVLAFYKISESCIWEDDVEKCLESFVFY